MANDKFAVADGFLTKASGYQFRYIVSNQPFGIFRRGS